MRIVEPLIFSSLIASARGVHPQQSQRQVKVVEAEVSNPILEGTMTDSTPALPPPTPS